MHLAPTVDGAGERTMSMTRRLQTASTLARANLGLFERPDRMALAMVSAAPWGQSAIAALASSVARDPGRAAVVDDDGTLSYRDLWKRSDAVARELVGLGAGRGVPVGLLARDHRAFVEVLVAVSKTGADLVLLNTGFAGPQVAEVVESEGISILIHDHEFAPAVEPCRALCTLVDMSTAGAMARRGGTVLPTRHQGRTVILTSGTTGRPKGAARSVGSGALEGVAALLSRIPLRARDVQVVAAPLFHAWGLSHLLLGLGRCATTIVAPRFDAAATLERVSRERARVLVVVPVMLRRMLALEPEQLVAADTSALRVIAASGSALGSQLANAVADRWGPVLYNTYGSTEVAVASVASPSDLRRHPATVGRPAPGVRVEILDDEGEPVPNGTVGRIFVGNAARFDGYTGGGGKEVQRGLLCSGDVGHFDEDQYLYVDGRDDDMIVSGGENVFPAEVEDLLAHHPDIVEAAVVGVADPEFGQALAAYVVRRPGAEPDGPAVKRYVRDNLARFKAPKHVHFLDELPRNQTGKIVKRLLGTR